MCSESLPEAKRVADCLARWGLPPVHDWTLLYEFRKSEMKQESPDPHVSFHAQCDHQAPTVVLVRYSDNMFGGYTAVPWDSPFPEDKDKRDPTAFLFRLRQHGMCRDEKVPLLDANCLQAVKLIKDMGPCFGENDMWINLKGGHPRVWHDTDPEKEFEKSISHFNCYGDEGQSLLARLQGGGSLSPQYFWVPDHVLVFRMQTA